MNEKHTGTVKHHLSAAKLPQLTPEQKSRLRSIKDEGIDYSDAPSQINMTWTRPGALVQSENKRQLTVRLDADVLAFFKSTGKRYQSRMNAALREYMNAHKKAM